MPESAPPVHAVLEALSFALFLRDDAGTLRSSGIPPKWLTRLWPAASHPGAELPLSDASPFLENFLVDANEAWRDTSGKRVRSGPWVERGADGAEVQLEATALTAGGYRVLLIECLGEAFEESRLVLQRARETAIAYQRLDAEIQKKQILVHSLAEDISAGLGNIITALRLMELENNPPKTTQLLGLALRGTDAQRSLMHKLLDLFGEELRGLYGPAGGSAATADLPLVLRRSITALAPRFEEKRVRLREGEVVGAIAIAAEAGQLERIISNLLENALENSAAGGEVEICLTEGPEGVHLRIEDHGMELTSETFARIVSTFESKHAPSHAAFLRLHFCRIAVESCNGEFGYDLIESGGNCFWIQLPKSRTRP